MAIGKWTTDHSFGAASISPSGAIGVAMANGESAGRAEPFSRLAIYQGGAWHDGGSANWDFVALTYTMEPREQFAMVGAYGEVRVAGDGSHAAQIGDADASPARFGMIRDARNIAGQVWACGMKRQVYRSDGVSQWTFVSREIISDAGVLGFEAIDGFAADDVYAAGWEGELYRFDGSAWSSCKSPVDALLVDVCCAGDGNVYAIGRGALALRGRGDTWQCLPCPGELLGLCWFKDALWAAGDRGLFTLEGETWTPAGGAMLGDVVASRDRLVAFGAKGLIAFDGEAFTQLD